MQGLLFGLVLGFLLARVFVAYRHLLMKPRFLLRAEYHVFLPGTNFPDQNEYMDRVIKPGEFGQPIGPKEGVLLSDVRLSVSHILRTKNPHLFRPDLLAEGLDLDKETLDALIRSQSLARVRYLSDEPVEGRRYLQLLPYLAESIAALGQAELIYDSIAERLYRVADFRKMLKESSDATRFELQMNVLQVQDMGHLAFETKGLRKLGLSDCRTRPLQSDLRTLAHAIMEEAAQQLWNMGSIPDALEVKAFDDTFMLHFDFELKAFQHPAGVQRDVRNPIIPVDIRRRQAL